MSTTCRLAAVALLAVLLSICSCPVSAANAAPSSRYRVVGSVLTPIGGWWDSGDNRGLMKLEEVSSARYSFASTLIFFCLLASNSIQCFLLFSLFLYTRVH